MTNKLIKILAVLGACALTGSANAQMLSERGLERQGPAEQSDKKDCSGTRIIGGECASPGSWPWQVALFKRADDKGNFSFFCGGSVIAPHWILTAAHCVVDNGKLRAPQDILVIEGAHRLGNGQGQQIEVTSLIAHEGWNPKTLENDIALLNIKQEARSAPISTATAADAALETPGRSATVTGWGVLHPFHAAMDPNGKSLGYFIDEATDQKLTQDDAAKFMTKDLMQVALPIRSVAECAQAYQGKVKDLPTIDDKLICAGSFAGDKDTCYGDSGGPLVAQNAENQWVQIGIVSCGARCGVTALPGFYSRVTTFQTWIQGKTGIDQNQPPKDTSDVVETGTGAPNPAHLEVAFVQGKTLHVGQSVQVAVAAQKPGYLLLFDATPDGKITQIYPSDLSMRSALGSNLRPITPGTVVLFPDPKNPYAGFSFSASPPAGRGKLVAVLTSKKIKELNIPQSPKTFSTRRQVLPFLDLVVKGVNRDLEESSASDPTASVAVFDYTIE